MLVRWTVPAAGDLQHIKSYLDQNHPHLSHSTIAKLSEGIRSLKALPERGRVGLKAGTRELVLPPLPYVVVYRVRPDAVEILRIYHGAQKRT